MVNVYSTFIFAVLVEFVQPGGLDFILNPNPVASFLYSGTRVQIWASARNGPDVKSSEWSFRYDPILVPVLTEGNKTLTTTNRGNKWITQFTLALDDEKANLQGFHKLQNVYGSSAGFLLENVFALPVKHIKINIPDLFEELPEARFDTQKPCPEKSACLSFSRPTFLFRVVIVSKNQDDARKIEELLKTMPIYYEVTLAASTRKSTGSRFDHLLGVECKTLIETVELAPISGNFQLFTSGNLQPMPTSVAAEVTEKHGKNFSGLGMLNSWISAAERLTYEMKRQSRKGSDFNPAGVPMEKTGSKTRLVLDFTDSFEVGFDCYDIFRKQSAKKSGIYLIHPSNLIQGPWRVYCDMENDGGGWTVFQVRDDVEPKENFTRNWIDYKLGFGEFDREFWLGNTLLWALTNANLQGENELLISLEDMDGGKAFARYQNFIVGPEKEQFKLFIGDYTGNAGDSLRKHNGSNFSTVDNDSSCANVYKGGWWYNKCHLVNLNGRYLAGPYTGYADGINWHSWKGHHYSLKKTTMKFRHWQDETLTKYDIPELLSNVNTLTKPKYSEKI